MKVTRRYFLRSSGAVAAGLGLMPLAWLGGRTAFAAAPVKRGRTLVVVFLRGGVDGLNFVVPHGDPGYAKLRPTLGLKAPAKGDAEACLDLDGAFGLHPRLAPLGPWFERGLAVAAHAVGYDGNSRSHFEEQDVWETGIASNDLRADGWLNRHLATSEGHGRVRAVAVGSTLPRICRGKATAYAIRDLDDLTLAGARAKPDRAAALQDGLEAAYGDGTDVLDRAARDTLEGLAELRAAATRKLDASAVYPNTGLGRQLRSIAHLVKADIGLEVAEVDYGGWDTHQNQGRGAQGAFANLCGGLSTALDAFAKDLGDRMDDVLVLTLSDFGRTARENGTGGTDHGWGNAMLLMGGSVAKARKADGRRVVTEWPGLATEALHQRRDLKHTIDFRDVIAEVVATHLGNPNVAAVMPGRPGKRVGLVGS